MRKICLMGLLITAVLFLGMSGCATAPASGGKAGLSFKGWRAWGGLRAVVEGNAVTLNGTGPTTGYLSERLSKTLAGRRVTLEIENAGASHFDGGSPEWNRMLKITVNQMDMLVRPANVDQLHSDEYVPASYSAITFTLPEDFDGKLGFVFYQAELKDLKITAWYE